MIITIDIPDDIKSTQIEEADLPTDWKKIPNPTSTQKIGDDFVKENKYCVLIVPSAVVQGDNDVLINPCHKDFGKITITKTEKFQFDESN